MLPTTPPAATSALGNALRFCVENHRLTLHEAQTIAVAIGFMDEFFHNERATAEAAREVWSKAGYGIEDLRALTTVKIRAVQTFKP